LKDLLQVFERSFKGLQRPSRDVVKNVRVFLKAFARPLKGPWKAFERTKSFKGLLQAGFDKAFKGSLKTLRNVFEI
jgi:hypothetical protein